MKDLKFLVCDYNHIPDHTKNRIVLQMDNWNDFGYYTTFILVYIDSNGDSKNIGHVRIGFSGQNINESIINHTGILDLTKFEKKHFSLGGGEEYYASLNELEEPIRKFILEGLNDIAYNKDIFEDAINEEVTKISLLRGTTINTVKDQYYRIVHGGAILTNYNFSYIIDKSELYKLDFNVVANSNPPTNIHTIIGSNGVGKSYLINNMIKSVLESKNSQGKFVFNKSYSSNTDQFSNIIYINFSAFDNYNKMDSSTSLDIGYHDVSLSDPNNPSEAFYSSISNIIETFKFKLWSDTLNHLNSDKIFNELDITKSINSDTDTKEHKSEIIKLFNNLSSGHKIVLLTITRLIELAQEKTLIFFDEPEMHLHPPLLSSFIRALSSLLIKKNSVCLITTHSPIILQEVPRDCVYKYYRHGNESKFDRPKIETFGENISVLTNDIFKLELTQSGYYKILEKLVDDFNTYEDALISINDKLGLEGKSILRSLFFFKTNS